jgi:hypothetical protein
MFLRPEYPLGRLLALNASGEHALWAASRRSATRLLTIGREALNTA